MLPPLQHSALTAFPTSHMPQGFTAVIHKLFTWQANNSSGSLVHWLRLSGWVHTMDTTTKDQRKVT